MARLAPAAPDGFPLNLGSPPVARYDPRGHCTGLMTRNEETARTAASRIGAYVVEIAWEAWQPNGQGSALVQEQVDALLAEDAWATANGKGIRVRIFTGGNAPAWAKAINGYAPYGYTSSDGGNPITMGPHWRADYHAAYRTFLEQLAGVLAGAPSVLEVTNSACMTVYAEPFIQGYYTAYQNTDAWRDGLLASGFSRLELEQRFRESVQTHYDVFAPIGVATYLAHNPYVALGDDGSLKRVHDFTYEVMALEAGSGSDGQFCVIGNNSIGDNPGGAGTGGPLGLRGDTYEDMWTRMESYAGTGLPVSFQTMTLPKMTNTHLAGHPTPYGTAALVASMGGRGVELPWDWTSNTLGQAPDPNGDPSGDYTISQAEADALNAMLGGGRRAAPARWWSRGRVAAWLAGRGVVLGPGALAELTDAELLGLALDLLDSERP